jgi:hypothetical protein
MLTSRTTISGLSCSARFTASRPVLASPHTSQPERVLKSSRNPRRIMSWSSATRIRNVLFPFLNQFFVHCLRSTSIPPAGARISEDQTKFTPRGYRARNQQKHTILSVMCGLDAVGEARLSPQTSRRKPGAPPFNVSETARYTLASIVCSWLSFSNNQEGQRPNAFGALPPAKPPTARKNTKK